MCNVKLSLKNQVHAIFKFQIRDENGDISRETDWFENLVLNQGLDLMASSGWLAVCMVGTGNSQPNELQTSLDNTLSFSNTIVSDISGATENQPHMKWQRRTFRFSAGTAAGNLSEVSIGGRDYIGNGFINTSWNRALIKDSSGSPTTITVLPTETLDVVVEVRLYIDTSDKIGVIDFGSGVVRNYILRPMKINTITGSSVSGLGGAWNGLYANAYSGGIGGITGNPSSRLPGSANSHTQGNYVSGSYKKTSTSKFNQGTSSGVIKSLSIEWANACFYQIELNEPITKTGTHELSITTEISWGRYVT